MDFEKEALRKVIETQKEELDKCEVGSEAQAQTVDCMVKCTDRLIEIERLEQEKVTNERSRKFENISRWVGHGIAIASVLLPLGVTVWGANKSWNFERDPDGGMVTSGAGRKFMDRIFARK